MKLAHEYDEWFMFRYSNWPCHIYRRPHGDGSHCQPGIRSWSRWNADSEGDCAFHSYHHRCGRLPWSQLLHHCLHSRLSLAGCRHLPHWNYRRQRAWRTSRYRNGKAWRFAIQRVPPKLINCIMLHRCWATTQFLVAYQIYTASCRERLVAIFFFNHVYSRRSHSQRSYNRRYS